ncbi:hypothetical protein VHUM_00489 [Vanrija humicola]|uniref:Uncharacterized protein n=1 Tax=Vanrija humicola TaxID=5417 RepID=A0A7D8ZBM0_VANHU|nr:hypothetical protein VHUM_00489 [Vanrija humicola]
MPPRTGRHRVRATAPARRQQQPHRRCSTMPMGTGSMRAARRPAALARRRSSAPSSSSSHRSTSLAPRCPRRRARQRPRSRSDVAIPSFERPVAGCGRMRRWSSGTRNGTGCLWAMCPTTSVNVPSTTPSANTRRTASARWCGTV